MASAAVYALVALGFVLIFRATNVVNFAQGEFSMVAAFLMVVFAVDLGWPYWLSRSSISLGGMAVLGALFNLGVYYPLRHRSYLPVIISTIGASILLANTTLALYGPAASSAPGLVRDAGLAWPEASSSTASTCSSSASRRLLVSLPILVLRTHAGRQEAAGDLAGQGHGLPARHSGRPHDHADLRL